MRRLADGDRAAFDVVFDNLWPLLKRYAQRALGEESQAEDAAQRALLKMFDQASTYDPTRPALAWGLSFAYWECRTERTRARRQRAGELPRELASGQESPEDAVVQRELLAIARGLLDELTPAERALLGDQVAPELTAEMSAHNPATLRKRRQRLLERLVDAWTSIVKPMEAPR